MNRLCGNSRRIARMVSTPLSPGMRRSMSVTSGRCCRNSRIASCPSRASATSAMSGSVAIMLPKPSRTIGWSSTITMRMVPCSPMDGLASSHRDFHDQLHAFSLAAEKAQLAAQVLHPFPDAGQAEVIGRGPVGGGFHVEPAPVVAHAQAHAAITVEQVHGDPLRARVAHGVGDRLLPDP